MTRWQENRKRTSPFYRWLTALIVGSLVASCAIAQDETTNNGFPLPFGFAPKTANESPTENVDNELEVAAPSKLANETDYILPVAPVAANLQTPPNESRSGVILATHEQSVEPLVDLTEEPVVIPVLTTESNRTPIVSRHSQSEVLMPSRSSNSKSLVTTFGALCIVLGLFMGFLWLMKRNGGMQSNPEHAPLVEVLGSYRIGPRNDVSVVRFGSKLLALSVSGNGTETLAELDDPQEVAYLTELCGTTNSATVPWRLRQAIDNLAESHTPRSTYNLSLIHI